MKLSKRDAGLLIVLLGLGIFLVCYLAFYNPTVAENDALTAEISTLRPVLADLRAKEAQMNTYIEGISESKETMWRVQSGFPTEIRAEDLIMYAVSIENGVGLDTEGVSFAQPTKLVELNGLADEQGESGFETKHAYKTSLSVNSLLTYEHLKSLVGYIYGSQSDKTTLDTLSVSYNGETGVLYGTIQVGKYFMTSDADPYIETYVPPMPTGVPNPFGTLDTLPKDRPPEELIEDAEGDGEDGEDDTGEE